MAEPSTKRGKPRKALRIETVINKPSDIGVLARLEHLPELIGKARGINARLLTLERAGQGCAIGDNVFDRLHQPYTREGQRTGALRFRDPRAMARAGAPCCIAHTVTGFTNKSLRALVTGLLGCDCSTNQMSHELRRLRLHGLIERIPGTITYQLTPEGTRTAMFFTKVRDHILGPFSTPATSHQHPSSYAAPFDAEIQFRKYPRVACSSDSLRGVVRNGPEWQAPGQEDGAEDEAGDLSAGDCGGDYSGRRGPQVGCGCVHDHRDPPHDRRCGVGGAISWAGPAWQGAQLAPRSRPGRGRAVDRGGQGVGHRAGDRAGEIRLGLNGPLPARVPAELKELVLKTVDEAQAAGFAHNWACALWGVADDCVHRRRARRAATGTLEDLAPRGNPVHRLLDWEVADETGTATMRSHDSKDGALV